ncbi:hypothetical protein KIN20_000203 [Parelaphostrongylus tenuis]|uniref:RNA cytosine-C(5)-methyltransferase NSUN2-like PUA domain-containing protein n=1 Tax=Parelaphostrongylus tenuis TaxID=148309 RepID=A0AAD5QBB6_PARTN|nr:hypothetical protein KIN20_000203 [Parelaphostrongylus tenuis]
MLLFSAPIFKKNKMFKDEPFTFLKKDDERWFRYQKPTMASKKTSNTRTCSVVRLAEHDVNCRQLFFANQCGEGFGRTKPMIQLESLKCRYAVREQSAGSLVLYSDRSNPVCTWVGFHTVSPYLCKEERIHMLRMMGVDCSEIEQMMRSKRKHKAAAERLAASEENETNKVVIQERFF